MKIFRALNFQNLKYLINDELNAEWRAAERNSAQNWWFATRYAWLKDDIIGHVIFEGTEAIVKESLYFTSLVGGRWNLPKSYGILYCSENPLLSCLEVAYHNLVGGLPYFRQLKTIEDKIRASIEWTVPDEMRFLVIVLVFELEAGEKPRVLDTSVGSVKAICERAGFANYTRSPNFDRDFIFGNDYIITQTIGALLYGQNTKLIKVGSARTDHATRVVLLTERAFHGSAWPLTLKHDYYEFECRVRPLAQTPCYEVAVKARWRSGVLDIDMHLDRVSRRPTTRSKGARLYQPANTRSSERDGRLVVLQKYHLPKDCPYAGKR